ncbi:MAG: hypothetical protein FJZ89_10665 [Chloroflexi bacterium]|nr:hypothetical protein [Chloroflexota bacterium]
MNLNVRDILVPLFCIVAGPVMIWGGWKRVHEGRLPNDWLEHYRILSYINDLNGLLGRPSQERITIRQMRVMGVLYMILGVAVLGGGIVGVVKLLQFI